MRKAVAVPNSPPAEKPWSSRETRITTPAHAPIEAAVGANAMIAVPSIMAKIVSVRACLRPARSPYAPITMAPIGRIR